MQIDMHYYGTYAMARAAGLSAEAAGTIATAAQYVDDNVADSAVVLKDGARLLRKPTAHELHQVKDNVDRNDQRDVWLPFHFLPGNEVEDGEPDDNLTRLICRKDSEPARQMRATLVETAAMDPNALERAGIIAHVYADTFSHYGFAGVSSERNAVDGGKFEFGHDDKLNAALQASGGKFFERYGKRTVAMFSSMVGEVGANLLGHGSVATYPDQPYLKWSYVTERSQQRRHRDNPTDFLDGCRELHGMFRELADVLPGNLVADNGRDFSAIAERVRLVLADTGDKDARALAWQAAAAAGDLFVAPEAIPQYAGKAWTAWMDGAGSVTSAEAMEHPVCRFHLAANAHRAWVQYTLLPARNLLVA